MGRLTAIAVAGVCWALSFGGCASAGVTAAGPSPGWGRAEPVPGLAALTVRGGENALNSVSCATPGNCGAGGYYQATANPSANRGFVVSEVAGAWGRAEPVPGLAALDTGLDSQVTSMSCPSPGNCTAGGNDTIRGGHGLTPSVFVVSQVRGRWGKARRLPGFSAVNQGGVADLYSVSCASAGNCVAGGADSPSATQTGCCRHQGFVVSQINGVWGKPHQVPGTKQIDSVSCPAAGECAAAGRLVLSESGGKWTKPVLIRGSGGLARLTSISCASPGNCGAVGYLDAKVKCCLEPVAAVAASLAHGTWGAARRIAGTAPLKPRGLPSLTEISCTRAGQCVAGGDNALDVEAGSSTREYADPLLVSQASGTWSSTRSVPGIAALSKFGYAVITALSCSSSGNCSIGGVYATDPDTTEDDGLGQPFVATEIRGIWHTAIPVKTATSRQQPISLTSISCPASERCTATGISFVNGQLQAFVLAQTSRSK